MISGSVIAHFMDTNTGQDRASIVNDDLSAAVMAQACDHVSLWRRVQVRIWHALDRVAELRHSRPETLDAAMARLAETSPHLLADIGMQVRIVTPHFYTPAGRGLVRVALVEPDTTAALPPAKVAVPVADCDRTAGSPVPNLVPAH